MRHLGEDKTAVGGFKVDDLRLKRFHVRRQGIRLVDRLRVGWLNGFSFITSTGALGGVPREPKMLTGHLHRVICHQVY